MTGTVHHRTFGTSEKVGFMSLVAVMVEGLLGKFSGLTRIPV
ncbi:hypothetical protein V7089_02730 [Neobacillus drentensis]